MMDGRTMANYGDKAFRLGFDVVLPVADIITDESLQFQYMKREDIIILFSYTQETLLYSTFFIDYAETHYELYFNRTW